MAGLYIDAVLHTGRNGESYVLSMGFRCLRACNIVLYLVGVFAGGLIPFLLTVPRPAEPGLRCTSPFLSVDGEDAVAVRPPTPLGARLECVGLVRARGSVVEEEREPLMEEFDAMRNESDEL